MERSSRMPLQIRRWPLSLRLRALIVSALIIPVIMACARQVTGTVISLDNAPASSLYLSVEFIGALIPGATAAILVTVNDKNHNYVAFTGGQRLIINGITIPEAGYDQFAPPTRKLLIPRLAAGSNIYTVVYDDGHGRQTKVVIPGPHVDFAILQPAPGSKVPLPKVVGTGSQGGPTPEPSDTREPSLAHIPFMVHYTMPFAVDELPLFAPPTAESSINTNDYFFSFDLYGVCDGQWPNCIGVRSSTGQPGSLTTIPTGTWLIDDSQWILGAGFEMFDPGPGSIKAHVHVAWNVQGTGFSNFYVHFDDDLTVPITWVRG